MAKFEVTVAETIIKTITYQLSVSRKQVVDALGLEGDDAKDWKDHVQDYVSDNWSELVDKAIEPETTDESTEDVEVTDVAAID